MEFCIVCMLAHEMYAFTITALNDDDNAIIVWSFIMSPLIVVMLIYCYFISAINIRDMLL